MIQHSPPSRMRKASRTQVQPSARVKSKTQRDNIKAQYTQYYRTMEKEETLKGPAYLRNVGSKIKHEHRMHLNTMHMQPQKQDEFIVEIYEGPKPEVKQPKRSEAKN